MASGTTRVVIAALLGNLGVAVAKFAAAMVSGSSAMLTEAVHSLVDTFDQVLLLIGQVRGRRPPNASHPLGYGMETYFWAFIVALMVFLLGGVISIRSGIARILHPAELGSPWLNLGVLAAAALMEGGSLLVGVREYRRTVRGRPVGLWDFIRGSKDPGVFSVLLEDTAALAGIAIAATGVVAASVFHIAWADGAASVAIGLILVFVAIVLANETRSLIAGEAVAAPVLERVKTALAEEDRIAGVEDIATLQLGPGDILVALTLRFHRPMQADAISDAVTCITRALREADPRIAHVYVRPPPPDAAELERKQS